MGAWIEIKETITETVKDLKSHPLWVRGLKWTGCLTCRT